MRSYTHYVFGVGPDLSWQIARHEGVVGINIMHGQYIFDTWVAPVPEHIILTGEAYVDNARKNLAQKAKIYSPGYILADEIKRFSPSSEKDIDCLVALPKIEEHTLIDTIRTIEKLNDIEGIIFRPHPRNANAIRELTSRGLRIDKRKDFYGTLSRAKCLLSGPSNCIIEGAVLGVPVGLLALRPDKSEMKRNNPVAVRRRLYFEKMAVTYGPIAEIFRNPKHMRSWIKNPTARPKENAKEYWKNVDGDIRPIINCFMDIVNN